MADSVAVLASAPISGELVQDEAVPATAEDWGGLGAKPPLNLSSVNKYVKFEDFLKDYNPSLADRHSECHKRIACYRDVESGLGVVRTNSCGIRGCPSCGGYQINRLLERYMPRLKELPNLKKVELTFGHSFSSAEEVSEVGRLFSLVLNRWWKDYFMALEISKGGHLHCHAFVSGVYVSQRALSAEAERVLGKPIVWISRVSPDRFKYLVKDLIKMVGLVDDAKRIAYFVLTRGVRMFRSCGMLYGLGKSLRSCSGLVFECILPRDSNAGRYWLDCVKRGVPPPYSWCADG